MPRVIQHRENKLKNLRVSNAQVCKRIGKFAIDAACEALWPTRCALCDRPGSVLCEPCRQDLPFVDLWKACPRCGAPFGAVQCDLCNPVFMARMGRDSLPFERSVSATMFSASSGHLVRVYKDQGERRLACELAKLMLPYVFEQWDIQALTYIPDTLAAFRNRGFDHGQLLAESLALELGIECIRDLERPLTRDQRELSAADRIANLKGRFSVTKIKRYYERILLVDDVLTTGATLCAASEILRGVLCDKVYCLTFARV